MHCIVALCLKVLSCGIRRLRCVALSYSADGLRDTASRPINHFTLYTELIILNQLKAGSHSPPPPRGAWVIIMKAL